MLLPSLPQYRRRRGSADRKLIPPTPPPPPPAALVLLAASFANDEPPILTLTFDRPVDPVNFIIEAFLVIDAEQSFAYYIPDGTWEMLGPATVKFNMVQTESA